MSRSVISRRANTETELIEGRGNKISGGAEKRRRRRGEIKSNLKRVGGLKGDARARVGISEAGIKMYGLAIPSTMYKKAPNA